MEGIRRIKDYPYAIDFAEAEKMATKTLLEALAIPPKLTGKTNWRF